jgi:hypothetical protein
MEKNQQSATILQNAMEFAAGGPSDSRASPFFLWLIKGLRLMQILKAVAMCMVVVASKEFVRGLG